MGEQQPVTELLARAKDPREMEALFSAVHDQLRALAGARLRRAGAAAAHLGVTEVVNESFEKLKRVIEHPETEFPDRQRFYAYAAKVMRTSIARLSREEMRSRALEALDEEFQPESVEPWMRVFIGDALEKLEAQYPRQVTAFDLKYFAGFTYDEIAREAGHGDAGRVRNDLALVRTKLALLFRE